ncbi:histone acetyltransferase TAF1/250, partial [Cardiosporidium cionae]
SNRLNPSPTETSLAQAERALKGSLGPFGTLRLTVDSLTFFGVKMQLKVGKSMALLENNLFRAPLFYHPRDPLKPLKDSKSMRFKDFRATDFLLIRVRNGTKTELVLRPLYMDSSHTVRRSNEEYMMGNYAAVYTVGQCEPKIEIPSPESKVYVDERKNQAKAWALRQALEKNITDIKRMKELTKKRFCPPVPEKEITQMLCSLDPTNRCIPKTDEVYIQRVIRCETICALESAQATQYRLRMIGIHTILSADPMIGVPTYIENEENKTQESYLSAMKKKREIEKYHQQNRHTQNIKMVEDSTSRLSHMSEKSCIETDIYQFMKKNAHLVRFIQEINREKLNGFLGSRYSSKQQGGLTGIQEDLRKLSMAELKQRLVSYRVDESVIKTLPRWDQVALVRQYRDGLGGGVGGEEGGRGSGKGGSLSPTEYEYRLNCIFNKQRLALEGDDPEMTDSDEEATISSPTSKQKDLPPAVSGESERVEGGTFDPSPTIPPVSSVEVHVSTLENRGNEESSNNRIAEGRKGGDLPPGISTAPISTKSTGIMSVREGRHVEASPPTSQGMVNARDAMADALLAGLTQDTDKEEIDDEEKDRRELELLRLREKARTAAPQTEEEKRFEELRGTFVPSIRWIRKLRTIPGDEFTSERVVYIYGEENIKTFIAWREQRNRIKRFRMLQTYGSKEGRIGKRVCRVCGQAGHIASNPNCPLYRGTKKQHTIKLPAKRHRSDLPFTDDEWDSQEETYAQEEAYFREVAGISHRMPPHASSYLEEGMMSKEEYEDEAFSLGETTRRGGYTYGRPEGSERMGRRGRGGRGMAEMAEQPLSDASYYYDGNPPAIAMPPYDQASLGESWQEASSMAVYPRKRKKTIKTGRREGTEEVNYLKNEYDEPLEELYYPDEREIGGKRRMHPSYVENPVDGLPMHYQNVHFDGSEDDLETQSALSRRGASSTSNSYLYSRRGHGDYPKRSKHAKRALKSALENFNVCLSRVVTYLLQQTYYKDFRHRIDERIAPNYYNVIKEPMWLSKILEKCKKRVYHTLQQFMRDMGLIVENCKTFNPLNSFSAYLRDFAARLYAEMLGKLDEQRSQLNEFERILAQMP